MAQIQFDGVVYDCEASETVLDALLRHGADVSYSCRKGICLSCVLKLRDGSVPAEAQNGLKDTLLDQGYFLPCQCVIDRDCEIARPDDAALYGRAVVIEKTHLAPTIVGLTIEPANPLYYHAGQFINLRRGDGLTRSYSIASVPRTDQHLILHIKQMPEGEMSHWVADDLEVGDGVEIQGPNGSCYYLPGRPDQKLLLIGNGTGLAPLVGVARDALQDDHRGEIWLYHGSRHADGLYLREMLDRLAADHPKFHYVPCLSGSDTANGVRPGRADAVGLADHPDLKECRVFACGNVPMVNGARKAAYLAGATLDDIYGDAFELREMRHQPRTDG
jgi:ferredoxin-NADP reductase/ferredoxin